MITIKKERKEKSKPVLQDETEKYGVDLEGACCLINLCD
jgi:hypothetical protein